MEETSDCQPVVFGRDGPSGATYVVIPAILGGLGSAIGLGIDALIRRDPTLFLRGDSRVMRAPSVGRSARGLSLSLRW